MLLHIIANPRPRGESRSLRLADAFLAGYRSANPGARVEEVNVFTADLPMGDALDVNTRIHQLQTGSLSADEKKRLDRFMRYITPLRECDRLLLTCPMWNFAPPWALKRWIDTVVQARITFEYTPSGPRGLLKGKKAAVVGARGGAYSQGDPRETSDFMLPYLRKILGWIGITDVVTCMADAIDKDPARRDEVMAMHEARAKELGAGF